MPKLVTTADNLGIAAFFFISVKVINFTSRSQDVAIASNIKWVCLM